MVKIYDKDGNVYLDGDSFDLKIDVNRKIYFKKKDTDRYESIGQETPIGMDSRSKQRFLYELYKQAIQRKNAEPQQ